MNFIKIKFNSNFEKEFHVIGPSFQRTECIWMPNVDVYESPEEIIILADVAGIDKEKLHVELNRKNIKIVGVRRIISVPSGTRYSLAEIPHGYFSRSISLPAAVNPESAAATYADGILMIKISKELDRKVHRVRIISE